MTMLCCYAAMYESEGLPELLACMSATIYQAGSSLNTGHSNTKIMFTDSTPISTNISCLSPSPAITV